MKCPHGLDVGDPPDVHACPRGFPYCACGDDLTTYVLGSSTDRTETVRWWEDHGPF